MNRKSDVKTKNTSVRQHVKSSRALIALITLCSALACTSAASPVTLRQMAASDSMAIPKPTPPDKLIDEIKSHSGSTMEDEDTVTSIGGRLDARKPAGTTKAQRETIEIVVREYLLKNPAVIREAMQALEAQEAKEKQQNAAKNLTTLKSDIYSDAGSPVAGNPKGDVTVVVFFDYNCGYCKKTLPGLDALIKKDPSIRLIYKEFPILGPQSQTAAQAAMAAERQGKYVEFHNALIAADGADENTIKDISKKLGLDYAKLQKDMVDLKLNEALERNLKLAAALQIEGTPAYIVGDRVIPGAIDADSLGKIVIEQRAKLNIGKTVSSTVEPKK